MANVVEPLQFDTNGLCYLEAQVLGDAYLTYETWKSHSTDHVGEDRGYFAEFLENREAIVETLRAPEVVRKLADKWSHDEDRYKFQARHKMRGIIIGPSIRSTMTVVLTVVVKSDHRIVTFFPAKKFFTRGEVVYGGTD